MGTRLAATQLAVHMEKRNIGLTVLEVTGGGSLGQVRVTSYCTRSDGWRESGTRLGLYTCYSTDTQSNQRT